jgi:hypothetical protein
MKFTGVVVEFSDGTKVPARVVVDSDEEHPVSLMRAMVQGKAATYQRLKGPTVVPVKVKASVGRARYTITRTASGADVSVTDPKEKGTASKTPAKKTSKPATKKKTGKK